MGNKMVGVDWRHFNFIGQLAPPEASLTLFLFLTSCQLMELNPYFPSFPLDFSDTFLP
jgi:hypothetical protein